MSSTSATSPTSFYTPSLHDALPILSVPAEVEELKQEIARDFPRILKENLIGIYLWGSLTYDAFDEDASDIDCVVVLERDLRSEEHTSELQSHHDIVCRLLLEKKNTK